MDYSSPVHEQRGDLRGLLLELSGAFAVCVQSDGSVPFSSSQRTMIIFQTPLPTRRKQLVERNAEQRLSQQIL